MGDCKHQDVVRVDFKRDEVGKLIDARLVNRDLCTNDARPDGIGSRVLRDVRERCVYVLDKPITQAWPALVVPERGGPKFCLGLRMKLDLHGAVRVLSESRLAQFPKGRFRRDPRRLHESAVATPQPTQRRRRRPLLPDWKAALERPERARAAEGEALQQAARLLT